MDKKRIVITSAGVVSSIGIGLEEFWGGLLAGKSGLSDITIFDTAEFNCKKGYEIQGFDPAKYLGSKGLRNLDRITKFLLVASELAVKGRTDLAEMGVVIGTAYGGLHSIFEFERTAIKENYTAVNPMHFPNTVLNAPASQINIRYGMTKLSETICTGICSGVDAIGLSSRYIQQGSLDVVLCGGADELSIEYFAGMYLRHMLSDEAQTIKPFAKDRKGTMLGEGAGVFVLESLEYAQKNNHPILAELVGYGTNFSANKNYTLENVVKGAMKAIDKALKDANLKPEEIDFISTNANGRSVEDYIEATALREYFGERLDIISLGNIKVNTGECLSASGALQVAEGIKILNEALIPGHPGVDKPDHNIEMIYLNEKNSPKKVTNILISCLSNNRFNSCLVLKKYQ